jgi:hypothetical protein
VQSVGISPYGPHPNVPDDPSTSCFDRSQVQFSSFLIQNSNFYSYMSQTFMLQGSHTAPTPVMSWGGSSVVGQTSMWTPPLPPAGYWLPPPLGGYWWWQRLPPGIQARVLALHPHLWARDTGHRRGHLHLESKPRHGECLRR